MTCLGRCEMHCMGHAAQPCLICIKFITLRVTDPLQLVHHGIIIQCIITVDSKYLQCIVSKSHSSEHETKDILDLPACTTPLMTIQRQQDFCLSGCQLVHGNQSEVPLCLQNV